MNSILESRTWQVLSSLREKGIPLHRLEDAYDSVESPVDENKLPTVDGATLANARVALMLAEIADGPAVAAYAFQTLYAEEQGCLSSPEREDVDTHHQRIVY